MASVAMVTKLTPAEPPSRRRNVRPRPGLPRRMAPLSRRLRLPTRPGGRLAWVAGKRGLLSLPNPRAVRLSCSALLHLQADQNHSRSGRVFRGPQRRPHSPAVRTEYIAAPASSLLAVVSRVVSICGGRMTTSTRRIRRAHTCDDSNEFEAMSSLRQEHLPIFRCPGLPGFPDHLITLGVSAGKRPPVDVDVCSLRCNDCVGFA